MREEDSRIIEQLQEEIAHLKEKDLKITELKEEIRKLRLALYGIKPSKKKGNKDSDKEPKPRSKKRGS
jgi:cell shape-determining protein MreC